MSGEKSKSSGETGENIVEKFFNIVGWKNANPNISFACFKGESHKRPGTKQGKREQHGIDAQYAYISGLESDVLINVLASVKHTKNSKYPKSLTSLVKNHIKDILDAEKCFQLSTHRKELSKQFVGQRYTKVRNVPILFFLSSNDAVDADYISCISNNRYIHQNFDVEEFYIIDNKKMTFLLDSINDIRSKFNDYEVFFHHSSSSLNHMDYNKPPYSNVMPVEFLGSPFISFILKKGDPGSEVFKYVIYSQDEITEESLSNYIFIAKEQTAKIAGSYGIGFYNYYKDDHEEIVNTSLRKHNLTIDHVTVFNMKPNFRNLNDE
ncbi:GapS4a family protein [Vibrio cidicii]